MKLYGVLPGGITGRGGMLARQIAEALPYMKMHLVDGTAIHLGWGQRGLHERGLRLRMLLSYHYYGKLDIPQVFAKHFREPWPEVFIDSGAFSAATQGTSIDMDAYAGYLVRNAPYITAYANLDVIGDAEATWRNQQTLEAKGLAPLPVFHVGEPWRYLERYIERYPYIALGGMVPYMKQGERARIMPWLVRAFKLAQGPDGAPRSVYHGFGATSWEIVKAFPWYSVDSSSWGQGYRFGQVPLFDSRAGQFRKVDLGDHQQAYQYTRQFRELGFDPGDFGDRARYDRAKMCAVSALSYMHAEAWLTRRHGVVALPRHAGNGQEDEGGLRLYLGATTKDTNGADMARLAPLHNRLAGEES